MISNEKIKEIMMMFDEMKNKPHLFLPDNQPPIVTYLEGFLLACDVFEINEIFGTAFSEAEIKRGWRPTAKHVFEQMQRKGLSDAEIMSEMLDIFIEAWKIIKEERESNNNGD